MPLQQALESLNVNLEQELMRFRQSRSKDGMAQPFSSQIKFRSKKRRRGLNLIQVKAQAQASSPQTPPSSVSHPLAQTVSTPTDPSAVSSSVASPSPVMSPPAGPRQSSLTVDQGLPSAQTYGPQATTGRALQRRGGPITPYQQLPNDYLESTEALLDSLPSAYDDNQSYQDVDYEPSLREQLATPLGIGMLLLLLVGSAGFGYVVTSPKTAEFLRDNALVQALFGGASEGEMEVEEEPPVDITEATPEQPETGLRGIGPDLSEDEFKDLDLGRLSTLKQDEAASPPAASPLAGDLPLDETTATDGSRARSSGLRNNQEADRTQASRTTAASEAGSSGGTANRAPAQPTHVTRPQTAAAPQPVTAPSPRASSRPTVTPLPQAVQSPQPVRQAPPQPVRTAPPTVTTSPPQPLATSPTPQPLPQPQAAPPAPLPQAATSPTSSASSAPPAPITQPPPQPATSYYVVTDYTGDQSLQNARGAVGGAYVRNFSDGARIQMGAFAQESAARNLVQQLQGQGIPARVYSP